MRKYKSINKCCVVCKKYFETNYNNRRVKTCSKKCTKELRSKNRLINGTNAKLIIVNCSNCNANLIRSLSSVNTNKTQKYFCSSACKRKILSISRTTVGKYTNKTYIRNVNAVCYMCGESRKYLLDIHHLDGNKLNNIDMNIIPLCKKCHAIMHLSFDKRGIVYGCKKLSTDELIEKVTGIKDFIKSYKGFKSAISDYCI